MRPIDMMMMPPKSQEATQSHQSNQHRMEHAQSQAHIHFSEEVRNKGQKTVEATPKDNDSYRYDAKEKGNNSYSGEQKKRKKKEEESEKENKIIKVSNFDMRI